MFIDISNLDVTNETLKKIRDRMFEQDLSRVMRYIPAVIGSIWLNLFKEHGKRFGGWKQPGIWTKLLRAKGKHKKFTDADSVRNHTVNPLEDTGILKMSFAFKNKNATYGFKDAGVFGGSALGYAEKLDKGYDSDPFVFGEPQEVRVFNNLSMTLPGAKPKKTPKGYESHAKKHWNPYFFITKNAMRKAAKNRRVFKIAKRKLSIDGESDVMPNEMTSIVNALQAGIDEVIEGYEK